MTDAPGTRRPPSILLILYGATAGISVVKLYAAALLPGFLLAGLYMIYVVGRCVINPSLAPKLPKEETDLPFGQVMYALLTSFFPLALLILSVLGAILFGLATPSEAAAVGAFGAFLLAAIYRALTFERLKEAVYLTARTTAMRSDGLAPHRHREITMRRRHADRGRPPPESSKPRSRARSRARSAPPQRRSAAAPQRRSAAAPQHRAPQRRTPTRRCD